MQLRRPTIFQRDQPARAGTRTPRSGPGSPSSGRQSNAPRTRFELTRAAQTEPKRHVPWGRWFRGVAAMLMIGALGYGGSWLYLSDTLRVQQVDVTGLAVVDAYAVATAADLDARSLFTADLEAAAARIEALPGVASATVARDWPHGASIAVTEHQGWGYWQAAGRRVMVDALGQPHTLARPPASDAPTIIDLTAPTDFVSGVDVDTALPGGGDVDADTVQLVARLREDGVFAELGVQPNGYVFHRDRGLTVVVDDAPDAVFGDSTNYAFKVSTWSALLDQLAAEALLVAEIDLRFGRNVVLR